MKYFSKITSYGYTPKNKLQESAQRLSKSRDQLLIDGSDVDEWISDIERRVKALNDYFGRCTPLNVSRDKSHNDDNILVRCDNVFTITLYDVKNSHDPEVKEPEKSN